MLMNVVTQCCYAGAYDHVSRIGVLELEKPKGFRFGVGQFLMLNIPWIGKITYEGKTLKLRFLSFSLAYFNWHAVQITSGPKENVRKETSQYSFTHHTLYS